jgi:parvulin-like peptidyl-prolyl isomerase
MSFRNRPVLDRRRRPRWQDELRTQQLVVVGFAVAIALAIGIYGATIWSGYWEAHLRPVAAVGDTSFTTSHLSERERVIQTELAEEAIELQSQLIDGPRDSLIQSELESLNTQLTDVSGEAADSLVDGEVLAQRASDFGISVSDEEVDAAIAQRAQVSERVALEVIVLNALPGDADADAEPTDEQRAAARDEAQEALDRHEAGEEFGALASELSDDFSASFEGRLGWIEEGDSAYDDYFEAARDAEVEDVVGPIEVDEGWALVRLAHRREAGPNEVRKRLLADVAVSEHAYRSYVHDELLVEAFRDHFVDTILAGDLSQRRVAQIQISLGEMTEPVPEERARHVLVQPDPELGGEQDSATDEQWDAALTEAEEVRELLMADDADWFAVAAEHSDDTGSGVNGGDLGWYDPAASPFVPEFADALAELELMEVSEPVRSPFGYHVIQRTGERTSPLDLAAELVDQLRDDPDAFGELAERLSDDRATAQDGGELGWVAPYELDEAREEAIFALREVDEISDPVDLGADGLMIFKLLEIDEGREVDEARLDQIRETGFERWLDEEVRSGVAVWVDPQVAPTTAQR